MAQKRCPSCGGECDFNYEKGYVCKFCGCTLEADSLDDDESDKLELASAKRIEDYDFDGSLALCKQILDANPESIAANWCALLSEHKIVYLKTDEGKYAPTFLDPDGDGSLTESKYYARLDLRHKRIADDIEDMRRLVVRESKKISDYDVFISYRGKNQNGTESAESGWANAFYEKLSREHGKKLRVFYDKESLVGSNAGWEPHIYSALKSAKFMVVFGSSINNINATWVKNEWKRFAAYGRAGENKTIAVVGSGFSPTSLPDISLRAGQMIDSSDRLWLDRLVERAITACELSADDEEITHMLGLANAYIQKRDFGGAKKIYERIIKTTPKTAAAHWGLLKCRLKAFDDYDLIKSKRPLENFEEFAGAVRYANANEKKHYLSIQKRSLTRDAVGIDRPNFSVYMRTTKGARLTAKIVAAAIAVVLIAGAIFGGIAINNMGRFTVYFTDELGTHTIEVREGQAYSLENIPSKSGHDFLGLFDAEEGGKQYVGANGNSLGVFEDNKNVVLFPRFKAKEYTIVLDYGGAAVNDIRSIKVTYGQAIEMLPVGLKLESKTFAGWYTASDGGKQIGDGFGVLPTVKVTEDFFDITAADGNLYLYARFDIAKYSVIFNFGEGSASETLSVEHGTDISDIAPEKLVSGKAVLLWSTKKDDAEMANIFTGKVTGEMTLYAAELAPVITFDGMGGTTAKRIVARPGEKITLPVSERENYKFLGWTDESGKLLDISSMPENSLTLSAKWQAMIIFDCNGGTEAKNISEPQGTRITLPEIEKDGYIFAGWYHGSDKYENTVMPSESVKLKAGWWKIETKKVVVIEASKTGGGASSADFNSYYFKNSPSMSHFCYTLDLTDLYEKGVTSLSVKAHYFSKAEYAPFIYTHMYWYSEKEVSSSYQIWEYNEWHYTTEYEEYTRETAFILTKPKIYICLAAKRPSGGAIGAWWKDFYVEIEYPDMSTLY